MEKVIPTLIYIVYIYLFFKLVEILVSGRVLRLYV